MHRLATFYAIKPSGSSAREAHLLSLIVQIAVRTGEIDSDAIRRIHPAIHLPPERPSFRLVFVQPKQRLAGPERN